MKHRLILCWSLMNNLLKKNSHLVLIALILGISIFFRFYNLSSLFNFSLDEEVIAFHVGRISTGQHFPAIGVNAAGTGLYLGPLYFYAAAPFFVLMQNQAIAGAVFASALGVVTTTTLYWLGVTLFSRRVGVILSLLHATSLPLALFERKFFNPTPMTLVIALIFATLYKLSQKDSKSNKSSRVKYTILLGGLLGLLFHINLSLLWLIPFVFFWLTFKTRVTRTELGTLFLSILLLLVPLLVFELRHDWLQFRALGDLIQGVKNLESPEIPYYWGFPFTLPAKLLLMNVSSANISAELETCAQAIKNSFHWFGILVALISSVFAAKAFKNRSVQMLITSAFFGLASLVVYPGRVQEYYAFSLAVSSVGLVAYGLDALGKRTHFGVIVAVLSILVAANFWQLINLVHPFGLNAKLKVVQEITSQTTSRNYSLEETGESCSGYGLGYLLHTANHAPASSFADSIIGWLYAEHNKPIEGDFPVVQVMYNKASIKTNVVESKSF
jgi:4-amino-4-deoxy-L-arabinose transferase-like glycosyltransferase